MTGRTALVAGGSGLVGGYCLEELLASHRYDRVLAVGRRPLARSHQKLEARRADFDRLDALGDALRADDVFCCLGTTIRKAGTRDAFRRIDRDHPLALARAAAQYGAATFAVVSSLGADPTSRTFYLRVKGELEAALEALPLRTLLVFRPSVLLGPRAESRPVETVGKAILWAVTPLLRGRLAQYRPIHGRDVARAMVRLAGQDLEGTHVLESDEIRRVARG